MHDIWIDCVKCNKMTGVMKLDLSAAFDLVDHPILLKKLELLGFDQAAVTWFCSYLTAKSHCVYIDGKFSVFSEVNVGVPQGSVLGPLLYILFVKDLPEVVHCHGNGQDETLFSMNCKDFGGLCGYVDDRSYTFASSDATTLSRVRSTRNLQNI